jgi:hypothetical protein
MRLKRVLPIKIPAKRICGILKNRRLAAPSRLTVNARIASGLNREGKDGQAPGEGVRIQSKVKD